MNTQLWYFADAPSQGPGYAAVVDSEGCTICPPVPRSVAAEIIQAHNARDKMVAALKQARKWIRQEMLESGFSEERLDSPPDGSHLANINAALTAAGEQP